MKRKYIRIMGQKKNERTIAKLEEIGVGTIRISRNNVPHLLHNNKSVAWFWTTHTYRVFWPYPSARQEIKDFKSAQEVREFITEENDNDRSSNSNVSDKKQNQSACDCQTRNLPSEISNTRLAQ